MQVSRRLICVLCLLCGACAAFSQYQWERDPDAIACESVLWKQVDASRIPGLCGDSKHEAARGVSCSLGCLVVSRFSEAQAHSIYLADGMSLWQHEAIEHSMKGMKHQ